MMFKRRQPLSFLKRLVGYCYPQMGIRRTFRYYRYRAVRLPGTPASIAAGLACGAAVSFTPFIGLHFVLAFLMAYILGGNLLAAAIGTVIGNPLTFFFIWLAIYQTGNWLLGNINQESVIEEFADIVLHGQFFTRIDELFEPVLLPMIIGCIPYVILVWVATYFVSKKLIYQYQHRKKRRLKLLRKRVSKKV